MCEINDGERSQVWRESIHRARKPYTCRVCRAPIAVGDLYGLVFSVFDGEADTERSCFACDVARRDFYDEHNGGPMPSAIEEHLRECVRGAGPEHMSNEDRRWVAYLDGIDARWLAAQEQAC
jgi:hypothetical protein